jgi:predicted transcriptional regulator
VYEILYALKKEKTGLRHKDITMKITGTPQTSSILLKSLKEAELVEKRDRRYFITEKGREVLFHLEEILHIFTS